MIFHQSIDLSKEEEDHLAHFRLYLQEKQLSIPEGLVSVVNNLDMMMKTDCYSGIWKVRSTIMRSVTLKSWNIISGRDHFSLWHQL